MMNIINSIKLAKLNRKLDKLESELWMLESDVINFYDSHVYPGGMSPTRAMQISIVKAQIEDVKYQISLRESPVF